MCRLIDGKYPNYEAVIPKENPNKLMIDRSQF
jgi:DNA polymerase-3 subunit beta